MTVSVTLREAMRAEERAFDTLAKVKDGRYCAAMVEQVERHANAARERRIAIQRTVARAAQERHRAAVQGGKVLVTPSNLSRNRTDQPEARVVSVHCDLGVAGHPEP